MSDPASTNPIINRSQENRKFGFALRIWQTLGSDRKLMFGSVVFGLAFTGLAIIPPLVIREMIRKLEGVETATTFTMLGLILAVVYLLRGGTRYLYGLCSHVAAYRTLHRLMNAVYRKVQGMSPAFLQRQHSGNLVARTIGDVEAVEDFIAHGIPESLLAIIIPTTLSVVLFLINWKLALIALLPVPLVGLLIFCVTSSTHNYWRKVRKTFADVAAGIQDHVAGLLVIQSFTRERESADHIERLSRNYRDGIIHANTWSLVPAGLIEATSGAGIVLILFAGPWMISTDSSPAWIQISVADLVVFLLYLGQIFLPFLRLANLTEHLQKAAASADRVFELLDVQPEIVNHPQAAIPPSHTFDVAFENVGFGYEPASPVLNNVSFRIDEGETVAIVGETGAGKSTICHLLLRFHDATSGAITVGQTPLEQLPLSYLRENVALVAQDVFLFQGTIRENLLVGNSDATDEQIHAAARTANAEEFILSFPKGYETRVGERGVRLSGGQKQRIAIARAILKDAPILILDEATSAIDSATETLIKEALVEVMRGRTVLIVAHRLSTIKSADRIIVLDNGEIVESGTYDELLNADGHFNRLCRAHENVLW